MFSSPPPDDLTAIIAVGIGRHSRLFFIRFVSNCVCNERFFFPDGEEEEEEEEEEEAVVIVVDILDILAFFRARAHLAHLIRLVAPFVPKRRRPRRDMDI